MFVVCLFIVVFLVTCLWYVYHCFNLFFVLCALTCFATWFIFDKVGMDVGAVFASLLMFAMLGVDYLVVKAVLAGSLTVRHIVVDSTLHLWFLSMLYYMSRSLRSSKYMLPFTIQVLQVISPIFSLLCDTSMIGLLAMVVYLSIRRYMSRRLFPRVNKPFTHILN